MTNDQRHQRVASWMQRWNAGLTRFIERRIPQRVDAQDLAQEVYLRLLRFDQVEFINEPQAYLYRMASHVAAEWRERASQSKAHSSDELELLVDITTPREQVSDEADQQRFDHALRGLQPMVRAVVYLKLRDGMTHEQVARHLDITPRMVRRYLTAGYAELRVRLAEVAQ